MDESEYQGETKPKKLGWKWGMPNALLELALKLTYYIDWMWWLIQIES